MKRRLFLAAGGLAAARSWAAHDPLDTPARASALASRRPITAVARAGDGGVVAVGVRGHVLRSADGGRTWTQGRVPVSSDLTAVQFVDARTGWCTGHDGIVMKSTDGGASWATMLDGRGANARLVEHMTRVAAAHDDEATRHLLDEARRDAELGPDKPFLDLWFDSADDGFVVGAYNLVFHTADGGRQWEPWFDRTANPKLLSLHAIRPCAGALYVAGEAGLLLKRDRDAARFEALDGAYTGSWFGLVAVPGHDAPIAFGMRGHASRSDDGGRTWHAIDTGLLASITAGDAAADGRVALVDQSGGVAVSRDGGATFRRIANPTPMPLSAVAAVRGGLVLGGVGGLQFLDTEGAA